MKLVRGVKGREKPTGKTFLPTWRDFDAEISFIWANARLYNEDGSEIVQLAGQLEVSFDCHGPVISLISDNRHTVKSVSPKPVW